MVGYCRVAGGEYPGATNNVTYTSAGIVGTTRPARGTILDTQSSTNSAKFPHSLQAIQPLLHDGRRKSYGRITLQRLRGGQMSDVEEGLSDGDTTLASASTSTSRLGLTQTVLVKGQGMGHSSRAFLILAECQHPLNHFTRAQRFSDDAHSWTNLKGQDSTEYFLGLQCKKTSQDLRVCIGLGLCGRVDVSPCPGYLCPGLGRRKRSKCHC